jgi:signal transduction histidine kinase
MAGVPNPEKLNWSNEDIVTRFQMMPLFDGLSAEALIMLAEESCPTLYPKGAAILEEGHIYKGLYLTVSGTVDILKGDINQQPYRILRRGSGAILGEMSFVDGRPFSASAVAANACCVIVLPSQALTKLESKFPKDYLEAFRRIASGISMNLRQTTAILSRHLRRTADLTDALNQVMEHGRTRSAFIASISHDLRSPLNAIIGYAELMEMELYDVDMLANLEDLRRIRTAGRHLLGLIDNLMDFARIEANNVQYVTESVDLADVAKEVARGLKFMAEERCNTISVSGPTVRVMADRIKVVRIVMNLASNACKFSKDCDIVIQTEDTGEMGRVQVIDQGCGMSAEQLKTLTHPLTPEERKSLSNGTGLGLFISRHFTEHMDGALTLSSQEKKGTTAVVELPLDFI